MSGEHELARKAGSIRSSAPMTAVGVGPTVSVADLLTEPTRIADLHPSVIPALLCQLGAVQIALVGRLIAVGSNGDERTTTAEPDRLLSAEDAAAILGVTTKWLYRHKKLPFVRRLSRKALRVSESGLHRWMAAKGHDTSARLR